MSRASAVIHEDMQSQKRLWTFQIYGRAVIGLVLIAASIGVFGTESAEAVLRAAVIYIFLVVLFSVAGKRSLSEMNTFDLVLLLILSEATQNALLGGNESFGYGIIVILSLVSCEFVMEFLKSRVKGLENVLQGGPIILVENGKVLKERMRKSMVDLEDILSSARTTQGLERLDQIKYAVLENSGEISIIPKHS